MDKPDGLYILMISVHGLIRGRDPELGRDADTGGQVKYVLELARALSKHPGIDRVDLLTRRVIDSKVDPCYAEPYEQLAEKAFLVRLPCGPRRYLRKEVLWPYLDSFADQALQHVRRVGRVPDLVHGHYADAGYAGARVASLLGVPFVFTGHSLGRVKRARLLEQGLKEETIESHYNIQQRIEAEEMALDNAALVVASTHQEVEEQYKLYDNYAPRRMVVIPPGVDLDRFYPPRRPFRTPAIAEAIDRFLREPGKPLILALARPDPRKNLPALVEAYARTPRLRDLANLAVVAGTRDDIRSMERGPREVLMELLLLIDRYDLYGSVAYPKQHEPDDVPDLYRLAAYRRGVFANPALTEPFGLTLIEAAASGLPLVATADGGPRDIIGRLKNGLLIDPLDIEGMGEALREAIEDRARWKRWSRSGARGAHQYFSWSAHVERYLKEIRRMTAGTKRRRPIPVLKSRLPTADRVLISDIDNTLLGDREALAALLECLERSEGKIAFGVATGRSIESALEVLREWGVPPCDVYFTSVGSEIHYGANAIPDTSWERHIDYRWQPEKVQEVLKDVPGLRLQPKENQRRHKISYFIDPEKAPSVREISRRLRQHDVHANVIYSHQAYVDILPVRASKGRAVRYFALKWGLPFERLLVAGDSGNDEEMLTGNTLAVVVGNYSKELEKLRGRPLVYFAEGRNAWGILEGMEHYDFLGSVLVPSEGDVEGEFSE